MENNCPKCNANLEWDGDGYFCQSCERHYRQQAYCDKCQAPLEKLQACGALNYFCKRCNELKSKSTIKIHFTPS